MLIITFYTKHTILLPNLVFGYNLIILDNYFNSCIFACLKFYLTYIYIHKCIFNLTLTTEFVFLEFMMSLLLLR